MLGEFCQYPTGAKREAIDRAGDDTGHFQEREGRGGCALAVTRRKSRVAGKRCRTCGPFPMQRTSIISVATRPSSQQQASTRYVLMADALVIDFRAARYICCRRRL
jgi:hypothetical protein